MIETGSAEPVAFDVLDEYPGICSVTRVTPEDGFYVHTYYDVCPFSPSGRYLLCSRLPYQDRPPVYGDTADVCVIDLKEKTIRTLYTTRCWGHQTGTLAQWGATDQTVYTNDVIDDRAVCVRIHVESLETHVFNGPMYHIAPDESAIIGFPLEYMDITQRGYGLAAKNYDHPPGLPAGAAADQGIWKTDLRTGECELLLSLADAASAIPEPPPRTDGTFYFWHSKFNLQSSRIMVVLRCLFPDGSGGRNVNVFTLNPDGTDLVRTHSKPVWGHGGGHPNWHPDGIHLLRNLRPEGDADRLCKVPVDGGVPTVMSQTIEGGGHPTIEPGEKYIITDAMYEDNGPRVNIRLINVREQQEESVCIMPTLPRGGQISHSELRLDGHPAWDRTFQRICFQAAPCGNRQLFIARIETRS